MVIDESIIASASRDSTVRCWKINDLNESPTEWRLHSGYVNSLAFIAASHQYPKGMYMLLLLYFRKVIIIGLLVSGGQDGVINVMQPFVAGEASYVLLGHSANVCSLHTTSSGTIISGSWDKTARVWNNWQCTFELKGHDQAVWAVLAMQHDEYFTGSADKTIRKWKGSKQIATFTKHTDAVRGLCEINGIGIASCSNDGVVIMWSLKGDALREFHGHSSFVYTIGQLASSELISGGEDRAVRVWAENGDCTQVITHPSISVWCVATFSNGDFVSGSSDGTVRIFSRDPARIADAATLAEYDQTLSSAAIDKSQVGDIQKDKLPGVDVLSKRKGTKEGQVIMVKNKNVVEAHQWDAGSQSWTKIGDVMDAVGSSRKQLHDGIEYDFVFDVDVEDGKPPLKLPYNASQNPYEAATKFIQANDLPASYLEQVAAFITTNTKGVEIGQAAAPDPYSSSRYMPGSASPSAPPAPVLAPPKVLPQTQPLLFKQAGNFSLINEKILAFNKEVPQPLIQSELDHISALCQALSTTSTTAKIDDSGIATLLSAVMRWPLVNVFPFIDIMRLLVAASKMAPKMIDVIIRLLHRLFTETPTTTALDKSFDNAIMLSLRTLCNTFEHPDTRQALLNRLANVSYPCQSYQSPNLSTNRSSMNSNSVNFKMRRAILKSLLQPC